MLNIRSPNSIKQIIKHMKGQEDPNIIIGRKDARRSDF